MKNRWEHIQGDDYDLLAEQDDKAYINSAMGDRTGERVEANHQEHMLASFFGRIGYNYDEKYLFEATLRRDGSSNFAPNKRYAYFPSVSVGWVVTRESFMENISENALTFAKIRFSWGQNGNENIGAFNYTTNMTSSGQTATFGKDKEIYTGMRPQRLANPELTWETSEQTDLGVDLRFLNNALSFSIDLFNKKTKDMLMILPIPNYVGNSAPQGNIGTMSNKGVEMELGYRFRVGNVNINTSANTSYIRNKVTDIGADRNIGGNTWNNQTVTRTENDRPYRFFYGHVVEGIFRSQEEIQAHVSPNGVILQPDAVPGDFKFKNVNGDDVINNDDRDYIGQSNPDWLYGLNLGVDWNNFDFSVFFQGQSGNMIYDGTRRLEIATVNFQSKYLDRYHETLNPNGSFPRVTIQDTNNNYRINSFFLSKGNFLRMKNIQVGYTLPKDVLRVAGLSRLRVFVSMENAWTITKYKGFDPEVGNDGGIDKGNYPQARITTFGLNLAF